MSKVTRFRQDKMPKQQGEIGRLRVRKGSDAGSTFVLFQLPVSIGRGEENEVVISDLKASRKHATISREPKGRWFIQDNGSANGILYKERSERQFLIQHQSVFTVGQTEFEFVFADLLSELQPKNDRTRALSPFGSKAPAVSAPAINPLTGLPMAGRPSVPNYASSPKVSTSHSGGGESDKKKNLMIAGAAMLAFVLFFSQEQVAKKKKNQKAPIVKRDLASLLPPLEVGERVDAAESIFRSGFREYREKNYLRAKTLFETVLQVSPGHPLAEKYLQEAEHAISDDIQFHLKKGRQELNTGRLRTAKGHYETVIRLHFRTPNSPEAIEARDQLQIIRGKMKGSGVT
jgi:pSer/pThr/pTyr-binding forkhead associated (FHA) protein